MHKDMCFRLLVCLSFWVSFHPVTSTSFTCGDGDSSCAHQELLCSDSEDCSLDCTASLPEGCYNTTLICAVNQLCSVTCSAVQACSSMTIYGKDASELHVAATTTSGRILEQSDIFCPDGGNCLITCPRNGNCKNGNNFNAFRSHNVTLTTTADWAFSGATINASQANFLYILAEGYAPLNNAKVYCPENGRMASNGLPASCVIDTKEEWYGAYQSSIYAQEGLNDVKLLGKGFYYENNDVLFCGTNFEFSCDLERLRLDSVDYGVCSDDSRDGLLCSNYSLPTNNFTCGAGGTSCAHQELVCSVEGEDCFLDCTASSPEGCFNTTFTCAANQLCSVTCSASQACSSMTIYGNDASELQVTTTTTSGRILEQSDIFCPDGGNCVITCPRNGNCKNGNNFNAFRSHNVSLTTSGDWTFANSIINASQANFLYILAEGYAPLNSAKVYCPENGRMGSNSVSASCVIDTESEWYGALGASIYAQEGLNDVRLYGLGFYYENNDVLFCGKDFEFSCDLDRVYIDGEARGTCADDSRDGLVCANYSLPTISPTSLPTSVPTIVPSSMPSLLPSSQPTQVPTGVTNPPSTEPSELPSFRPTSVPLDPPDLSSIAPTVLPSDSPVVLSVVSANNTDTPVLGGGSGGDTQVSNNDKQNQEMNTEEIVIICVSIGVLVFIIIPGCVLCFRCKKKRDLLKHHLNLEDKTTSAISASSVAMSPMDKRPNGGHNAGGVAAGGSEPKSKALEDADSDVGEDDLDLDVIHFTTPFSGLTPAGDVDARETEDIAVDDLFETGTAAEGYTPQTGAAAQTADGDHGDIHDFDESSDGLVTGGAKMASTGAGDGAAGGEGDEVVVQINKTGGGGSEESMSSGEGHDIETH